MLRTTIISSLYYVFLPTPERPIIYTVDTTCKCTAAPARQKSRAICTGLFGYDIFTFAKGHGGLTLYGAIWKERSIVVYYKTFFLVCWRVWCGVGVFGKRDGSR